MDNVEDPRVKLSRILRKIGDKHIFMSQGKTAELRKYCQPGLNDETWSNSNLYSLVADGLCPPYLLPSTPVNGLCVPKYALAKPEEAEKMSINMTKIQVSQDMRLDPNMVIEGSKYALEKLAREKPLQDCVASKGFLFSSSFFPILLFCTGILFLKFLAKYICTRGYLEAWVEFVGKSTKSIKEAIRRIWLYKFILLVPFICLGLTFLLVIPTLHSSSLLASPTFKEFRVAGTCPQEMCLNNNTNKFYREGDLCTPDYFK